MFLPSLEDVLASLDALQRLRCEMRRSPTGTLHDGPVLTVAHRHDAAHGHARPAGRLVMAAHVSVSGLESL